MCAFLKGAHNEEAHNELNDNHLISNRKGETEFTVNFDDFTKKEKLEIGENERIVGSKIEGHNVLPGLKGSPCIPNSIQFFILIF